MYSINKILSRSRLWLIEVVQEIVMKALFAKVLGGVKGNNKAW